MIRVIIYLLVIISLYSCEKVLHPEEISIGNIQNYDQLLQATGGVYGKLASAFIDNHADFAHMKGDDINNSAPSYAGFYNSMNCWREYPHDIKTDTEWDNFFSVIASVNNLINQFSPASSEGSTRIILGEMYFIRAYCYFRLTRIYGQIPVIRDIDVDYSVTLSSYTDIYDYIEHDLKTAMTLLPENYSSSRIPFETPHRGVAKALLAEVYLTWAGYPTNDEMKYNQAMHTAGDVIDSMDYFGFGLLEDYSWLWDNEHLYNKESVFSLYYSNPETTSKLNEINLSYAGYLFSENMNNWSFIASPQKYISIFNPCAEVNFYNNYPESYRKEISFIQNIYIPSDYGLSDTGYVTIKHVEPCSRVGYRKFYFDPAIISYDIFYPDNFWFENTSFYFGSVRIYLYRFAHTLLTYAEAAARSGQLDGKAYECVNMIRRRANNVDINSPSKYDLQKGLSADAFADSVVWERAWEMAGEPEGRWFDLVRLEMVEDLPNLRHPQEGGPPKVFDKSAYFYPIPQGDIDLNPGLNE